MKKTHLLSVLFVVLFASCSKEASFIMEIPELTEGNVLVIYANPEQIEAGIQDTLASAAFTNGRFEAVFDSLAFDADYGDCSLVVTDKEGKFACNLPLPMRKGKKTSMKIGELNSFLKGESYLRTTYSGNDYAESFSDFFNKLITESENLQKHPEDTKQIYEKQVALYKSILEKYPNSGAAYSLLIGQIIGTSPSETNPLSDYCSELCLDVDYRNKWAVYLGNVMKDRQKKALSSSVLSFAALDINEKTFTEREIKPHKYVLICFWASWCKPCREEIPLLKDLYKQYNAKGLEIVSISIDTNPAEWLTYVKANPLPWLSLIGNGREITSRYNFEMIPMNIIADKDGKILKRELFGNDIRKAVEELMHE